jgi:RNA polymerase sigma factor (sigma-70 family)
MSREQIEEPGPDGISALTVRMERNEEEAYREFHRLYFARLLRYLIVVARGDEQRARDALQDTLLRVVKHIKRFDSEETFWSWLTVLARSSLSDQGRKTSRYGSMLERFFQNQPPPAQGDSHPADLAGLIEAAMEKLEPADRMAVEMKYLEGASVKEIAQSTGLSEKAVESRLARSRKILKETILHHLQNERTHRS